MNANTVTHISEDRIIQIIADGCAHAVEQAHLDRCGYCRATLDEFQADLDRFRQQAALAAPAPTKHFVLTTDLPDGNPGHRGRLGWAVLGTALSTALLAIFLHMGGEWRLPGLSSTPPPVAEWKDPEMVEINRLADNPLPAAYLALSESLDDALEKEFIDFLIPPLDGDPVS